MRPALENLKNHPNVKLGEFGRSIGVDVNFKNVLPNGDRRVLVKGINCIDLGTSDYLGYRNHPKMKEAAKAAVDKFGSGLTSTRLMSGNIDLHTELENLIANWIGREDCLIFSTGYGANLGLFSSLLSEGGECIAEAGVHASTLDGAKMSNARIRSFQRNAFNKLSRIMSKQKRPGARVVVVDGVYSMDGGESSLSQILNETNKYDNIITVVDEAHGLGVSGRGGRGNSADYTGKDGIELVTGSLSKAIASIGGFIAGDKSTLEALKVQSHPIMFSSASNPAALGAAIQAIKMMKVDEDGRIEKCRKLSETLRTSLKSIGADTWHSSSAIVPIVVGDPVAAGKAVKMLLDDGVHCGLSLWPAVPVDKSMIRFSVNAHLTDNDINEVVNKVSKTLKAVRD